MTSYVAGPEIQKKTALRCTFEDILRPQTYEDKEPPPTQTRHQASD